MCTPAAGYGIVASQLTKYSINGSVSALEAASEAGWSPVIAMSNCSIPILSYDPQAIISDCTTAAANDKGWQTALCDWAVQAVMYRGLLRHQGQEDMLAASRSRAAWSKPILSM